jgi:tripeptidyl-peptidase-1
VRDHIDYITPGITLREVSGVSQANKRSLDKRHINGGPASILPIAQGLLDELLGGLGLLDLCDVAVTPDCIQSMYRWAAYVSLC